MSTRTPSGSSTSVICAARDSADLTGSGLMSRFVCEYRYLKGPRHEIFVAGIFTQIRPVWVGDLGTRPKSPKSLYFCVWGLILSFISWDFCCSLQR